MTSGPELRWGGPSLRAKETPVPVLALDLDGTVREGKDDPLGKFVNGPDDVRVFPAAVTMMRRWKDAGGRIIGGIVAYDLVQAAMIETHKQTGGLFDKLAWCVHHPDADNPEMARCWCRKPSPGLLIESALDLAAHYHEFYPPYMGLFVGDRPEDEACAKACGFDFMWAHEWRAQADA